MQIDRDTDRQTDRDSYRCGFPGGAVGNESACQWRRNKRHRFNPVSARSPEVGNGNPLQYS